MMTQKMLRNAGLGLLAVVAVVSSPRRATPDAFFDVGDVANTTSFDLKRGVGIGFRWASPVGQIRLDLAHPLDDEDSDFRIHFSLGPDL